MSDKHISKKDYVVKSISISLGKEFISKYHYSGGGSRTAVYMHGMFRLSDNELVGVAQWLPPTKPAAMTVNKDNWTRVLSLSRLCVHPDIKTNGASFLMGRSIRLIKQDKKWVSLVTYADEFMNHTGQIYKACNWTYIGLMSANPRWEDENGNQVSIKSTVSRTKNQMIELGYKMVGKFKKHKFILHLT